ARSAAVSVEECEVVARHRASRDRRAGILGTKRLPHARRPVAGRAVRLVISAQDRSPLDLAARMDAQVPPQNPVWQFDWLTPRRCRAILAVVLLAGFLGNLRYLTHDCPLDLSGDEAHYWDWSRQLDLSYYSKGPLVAYIIRASCGAL